MAIAHSQSLKDHYLNPEEIEFFGTPRRLAVLIWGLPLRQPDQEEEIKGPPAQAAFKAGQPTKAAEGFAQKQGVDVSSLEIRTTEKGDFVFARKRSWADLSQRSWLSWYRVGLPGWKVGGLCAGQTET